MLEMLLDHPGSWVASWVTLLQISSLKPFRCEHGKFPCVYGGVEEVHMHKLLHPTILNHQYAFCSLL